MKDAKGHGSEKHGAASDQQTQARPPNFAHAKSSRRKHDQRGGGSGGGSGGGQAGGQMHPKTGAHTAGIHKALKMNLAQLSAASTNPAIPAPIIGGRK